MQPLDVTQREFFSALLMPLRGRSRASTDLAPVDDGHSPEFLAKAEALLKTGVNLTAAESMELYHRQYWFRVLDSIAEDFPILQKMAGEETFWALMEAYLLACPSESFTLRHLGSRLADFVAAWEELDGSRRRWFEAIARIEYAHMSCYEAAEWPSVTPDQLASEDLALQPHVCLLDLPVAADECAGWAAFLPKTETRTYLAVWRGPRGSVVQCRLDDVEFELLTRLQRGGPLEDLFAEPTTREPSPEEVSGWFASWQSRGWIAVRPASDAEDFPVVIRHPVSGVDWDRIDKMGSQARAMED